MSREFTKSVLKETWEGLESVGFKKGGAGLLISHVSEDVLGIVGTNTARGRGAGILEINAVMGVRNQRIERMLSSLMGEPFNEFVPPTLAGNIGYLSPANAYMPFLFSPDKPITPIVQEVVLVVREYGLPFLEKVANLSNLVGAMQTARFGIPSVVEYRIPIGLFLLGERASASEFIAGKLENIGSRADPAAQRYKSFAQKLLEHMG